MCGVGEARGQRVAAWGRREGCMQLREGGMGAALQRCVRDR